MKTFEEYIARKLSREEAIELYKSAITDSWTSEQIVRFQLFQRRLAVDFTRYHTALQEVLGRQVFTHEIFEEGHLEREYLGTKDAPSIDEIASLIPSEKLLIANINNKDNE